MTRALSQDSGVYLVQGRVKSLDRKKEPFNQSQVATIEITHVYSGPKSLLERTFEDRFLTIDFNGSATHVQFDIGEEGVWSIAEQKNVPNALNVSGIFCYARSRESDNTRHAQAVAVAESVEKLEKEKPEKRVASLRGWATSEIPEVSAWAIRNLVSSKEAEAGEYLDSLAKKPNSKIPLDGQVVLDEVLAKRKGIDWLTTEPRLAMLRGWVSSKQAEHECWQIGARIGAAHQREELTDKFALELLRAVVENKDWPTEIRIRTIDQFGKTARRAVNDEAKTTAYEWLFDQMRKSENIEFRRAASQSIGTNFPLYPKQLKAIEEHLTTEMDGEIVKTLRDAIQRARDAHKK
jgi:hypothetical protein